MSPASDSVAAVHPAASLFRWFRGPRGLRTKLLRGCVTCLDGERGGGGFLDEGWRDAWPSPLDGGGGGPGGRRAQGRGSRAFGSSLAPAP